MKCLMHLSALIVLVGECDLMIDLCPIMSAQSCRACACPFPDQAPQPASPLTSRLL